MTKLIVKIAIVLILFSNVATAQITPERVNVMKICRDADNLMQIGKFEESYKMAYNAMLLDSAYYEGFFIAGVDLYKQNLIESAKQTLANAYRLAPDDKKQFIDDILRVFDKDKQYQQLIMQAKEAYQNSYVAKAADLYYQAWQLLPSHSESGIIAASYFFDLKRYIIAGAIVTDLMKNADNINKSKALELYNNNKKEISDKCFDYTYYFHHSDYYTHSFISSLDTATLKCIAIIQPDNITVLQLLASKYLIADQITGYYNTLDRMLLLKSLQATDLFYTFDLFKAMSFEQTKAHIKNIRGDDFYNETYNHFNKMDQELRNIQGKWTLYYKFGMPGGIEEPKYIGNKYLDISINQYDIYFNNNTIEEKQSHSVVRTKTFSFVEVVTLYNGNHICAILDCNVSWRNNENQKYSQKLAFVGTNIIYRCSENDLNSELFYIENRGSDSAVELMKNQ